MIAAAFDRVNSHFATLSSAYAKIWNGSGKLIRMLNHPANGEFTAIAFDAWGRKILCGDHEGFITEMLWDVGTVIRRWQAHDGEVSAIIVVPDLEGFISLGWDGQVILHQTTRKGGVVASRKVTMHGSKEHGEVLCGDYSQGLGAICATGCSTGVVQLWYVSEGAQLGSQQVCRCASCLLHSPRSATATSSS